MSTNRKIYFANGYVYHVFNRGIDKRTTFHEKREYSRAKETLRYYHYFAPSIRFSAYLNLSFEDKFTYTTALKEHPKHITIMAYCFMSNHFHFLVRQESDNGISKFMANFANSYTKYFNAKHKRVGPLFQGLFKAVFVENTEQLMHVSRYIHLNPFVSSLISLENLEQYPWSSYSQYIGKTENGYIDTKSILELFKNKDAYKKFVIDHSAYAKELDKIKHLMIE